MFDKSEKPQQQYNNATNFFLINSVKINNIYKKIEGNDMVKRFISIIFFHTSVSFETIWNRNHPGIGNCLSWLVEVTYTVSREIMYYIECTSQFLSNEINLINLHMFRLHKNVLNYF